MAGRYGFPRIPLARWINTQAACSYLALPRALGKVLLVIGAAITKDDAGRRHVLSLSRPNRKTGCISRSPLRSWTASLPITKAMFEGLVEVHNEVHNAVGDLTGRERQVWELNQRINRRDLRIDTDFVRAAKGIVEGPKSELVEEFADLTDDLSPHQVTKTRDWLKSRGTLLDDLQEKTITEALDDLVLPDYVRRALQIRLVTAPTSLSKYDMMLACVGSDDRARGLFQYHAATLVGDPDPAAEFSALGDRNRGRSSRGARRGDQAGCGRELARWGDPVTVLSSALRYSFIPEPGAIFGGADFEMIETCVLLAVAGQRDKCALIEQGVDVYRDMAAVIYGLDRDAFLAIPKDEVTLEQQQQRHVGKNTVLGCGYSMGGDTFRRRYCRHLENAESFAEDVVYTHYRRNWAPRVPLLWRELDRAARQAMLQPGALVTAFLLLEDVDPHPDLDSAFNHQSLCNRWVSTDVLDHVGLEPADKLPEL
jgi:DNA polymerase